MFMLQQQKLPAMFWAEDIAANVVGRSQVRGTVAVSARESRHLCEGLAAATHSAEPPPTHATA